MNNEIPVFFTIDDAYAPYLAVALSSAIDHSDPGRCYHAVVLYQELTAENKKRLSTLEKDNFRVELTPMRTNFDALDDRMSNRLRCDYFTLTIYFRIFIPAMFPQYDKGIYIDSDIVLNDDIANLYDTDLGENLIGACRDLSIAGLQPLVTYTKDAVSMGENEYINSGVLLMNMKKLRELGFESHFLHLLNTYHFDTVAPDQDYINAVCRGKIKYLDERWDAMPDDTKPPLSSPSLIHYNLFSKPWCYDDVQYSEYFWKYAKVSGYYEDIINYKEHYTDEQKKADTECMELLVKRAGEIPHNDITFRKMHEKGVKIRL